MISPSCVDSILRDLRVLQQDQRLTSSMMNQIQILAYELEPLNLYLFCLAKLNDASEKNKFNCRNKILGCFSQRNKKYFGYGKEALIEATMGRAKEKLLETGSQALHFTKFEDWNTLASDLLGTTQHCKSKIKKDCLRFLDSSFEGVFSNDDLKVFMGIILNSLRNLLNFKANMIHDVKAKLESLKEKLDLFKEVFYLTSEWCNSREALEDFKIHTQSWAWNAAWLSLLYWILNETEEEMAPALNASISDILQRINPSTAEVMRTYFAVLKASKPPVLQTKTTVLKYVQFLLENSQIDLQNDGVQILHSVLLFLIAFLMYPPNEEKYTEKVELILTEAGAVINEAAFLISSLSADQFNEGVAKDSSYLLHGFVRKVIAIKEEVRKLKAHSFLHASSDFDLPMVNALEFIESIIENCKEISKPFPKHDIITLQKDLLSFAHFLKLSNLNEFKKEHKNLKDLLTRIFNMAYQAERVLSSFIYMSNSIWHDMLCLSDVMEQMKLIKGEIKMIDDHHMRKNDAFNVESCSSPIIPLQESIPGVDEVVGFNDKVNDILDRLQGGSAELDVISIIGMPGLGKTTLAMKVYNHPLIQYHFNKIAWCTISQTYDNKRLLLDILTRLSEHKSDFSKLDEEDLAEILHRHLKGQKYLIVMDDIWDIRAWDSIKMSFPNDKNGSRILFTSRICNVLLEAKSDHSSYPLSPLSEEESWKLLEKKLFYRDSCPPNFVWIGKQIARNCKGLPLAIVLVAGLLKENIENLVWWKEIRESLGSLIAKQGFADPLELSYKHLPDSLKPCFLYFGAFQEDQEINVRKLIQLWVSEGLIPKHDKKSLELVAKEYLMDLVTRSLVIVSKRSSTGGIKSCRIHDLLRDFCLVKGEEEKLLKVVNPRINGREFSWGAISNHYRLCIHGPWRIKSLSGIHSAQFVHSLLSLSTSDRDGIAFSTVSLSNLKFLRVLAFENFCFGKFPEEVTALVLLRYLEIRCDSSLPEAIGRLKSLETLHFHRWEMLQYSCILPLTIWGMEKLRHVDAGYCSIPPNFSSDLPALQNIQTFSSPGLRSREQAEMFLRTIPTVRKLRCKCYEIPKFDFLCLLESLTVTHTRDNKFEFYFPSNLKKLALRRFELAWTDISAIGKLPNLEVLKLMDNSIDGKLWNVEDVEFLKLKFLKLQSFNIQQWNVSDDAFPCLECLVLVNCRELEEIPSAFGNIPTLNMIQVRGCNSTVKSSAVQIKEDQLELGNADLKVLVGRY